MKRKYRSGLTIATMIAAIFALTGCGEDSGDGGNNNVENHAELTVAAEAGPSGGGGVDSVKVAFKDTTTIDTDVGKVKATIAGEATLKDDGNVEKITGEVTWTPVDNTSVSYKASLDDFGNGQVGLKYTGFSDVEVSGGYDIDKKMAKLEVKYKVW